MAQVFLIVCRSRDCEAALLKGDAAGRCLDFDAGFAVAEASAHLVFGCGAVQGERHGGFDVARAGTRFQAETGIRGKAQHYIAGVSVQLPKV